MHIDYAVVLLNYLLDYCEAQTDALVIYVSSALQFSEAREQLCDVVFMNASPGIFDVAYEDSTKHVVRHLDLNFSI